MLASRNASIENATTHILPQQLKFAKNAVKPKQVVPLWRTTKRKENVPCVKGRTNSSLPAPIKLRSSLKVPVEKFLSIISPLHYTM